METSLPPEIYANIISYLFFDTPSLKSCSLVCSNFRWLAQAQLFHDFTVHLLGNNEDHERMNLFLSSNEDSCRVIVGFTKTLTVLKNWELRHSATPAVAAVLSHWEDSSTLHHIRLVCDVIHLGWDAPRRDGLIDDYIDHPLVSSTIVRLANGRSLDLDWNGIRDDFILPLLSKTRQIDSIRLHKCHLPAGIAHLGKKFSPLYIRLGHITRIEPEISGVIFNGGRCQALTLASSFRNEVISLLFHQTGATLRHLTWKLSLFQDSRAYGWCFLDLSPTIFASFPQLHTCTFGFDHTHSFAETVAWLCKAISILPNPLLLSRIRLTIAEIWSISTLRFVARGSSFIPFEKTFSDTSLNHVLLQCYIQCKEINVGHMTGEHSEMAVYIGNVKQNLPKLEENGRFSLKFHNQHETLYDPFECEDCPSIEDRD